MVTKKEFIIAMVITVLSFISGSILLNYIISTENLVDYAFVGGTVAYASFLILGVYMTVVTLMTYIESRTKKVAFIA